VLLSFYRPRYKRVMEEEPSKKGTDTSEASLRV